MANEEYCGLCNEELWPQIVECMCCEKCFHWDCAGFDETMEEEEEWWLCDECRSWIYKSMETYSDSDNTESSYSSSNRSINTSNNSSSSENKSPSGSSVHESTTSSESSGQDNYYRCNSSTSPNQILGQNRKVVQQETVVSVKKILIRNQQVSIPTAALVKQDIKPIQSIEAVVLTEDNSARNHTTSNRSLKGASSGSNRSNKSKSASIKDLKSNNNKAAMRQLQKPIKRRSRQQGLNRMINETKPILSNKFRRIKKENTFKVDDSRDVHKYTENHFKGISLNDQHEPVNQSIQPSTFSNSTKSEDQSTLEHQFDNTSFENNQFKRQGAEEQVNRPAIIAPSQNTFSSVITPCHVRDVKQRMINQKATIEIKGPLEGPQRFNYSIEDDYKPIGQELPIQSTWGQRHSLKAKKVENQQGRELEKFEDQLPRYEVTVYTIYDQYMGFNVGQDYVIKQQGHREPFRCRIYQEISQGRLETLNRSYQSLDGQLLIDANSDLPINSYKHAYQNRLDKQVKIGKASQIHDCMPYLDENRVKRVEEKLDKANAKRPTKMPRNHLTRPLMFSYHRRFMHRNHETVINELRQRFYIPRVRVAFRSVRWKCKLCEVKRSRPKPPKMADLPTVRFEPGTRVFTYTGIYYFGPMHVMVGRRSEKRWGVLLTCLTVRATHIEIVHSLDTASCIKCLRNFINTRGAPLEFYNDNGTCFTGADKELKEELKKLNEFELSTVTSCYTKWNFNPPVSSHMGGCWERLIGVVKGCTNESMPTRTPKDEDLRSLYSKL